MRGNPKHQSDLPPNEPGVSEHPTRSDLGGVPARLIATCAPGTNAQVSPTGTAFRLEPGGLIELQMHDTATGQPASDRTKIGITFATDAQPREVRAQDFFNRTLTLPAGAADVAVTTELEFLQDATEPLQDNSSANKNNPNPHIDVLWGDQAWQEMQYTGVLLSAPSLD